MHERKPPHLLDRPSGLVRTWLLALFVLGGVLFPTTALAQDDTTEEGPTAPPKDPKEAARLKAEGDRHMDDLDYGKAFELYEQGYAVSSDPVFLYNGGRALQALNRYPEALDWLERFQREATPSLRARVPGLEELITKVRNNVATVTVQSKVAGARVLFGGKLVGTTPVKELRVNAGATKIEAFKDGYRPVSMTVKLAGNQARLIELELVVASETGVLVVESNAVGATVRVGLRELGTTPTQAELPVGEHTVTVLHPDYEDYESTVVIRAGANTRVMATLELTPPFYEQWWFWTLTGAVVVGGVVTGVAIAATTEREADTGTLRPGQVPAPFRTSPSATQVPSAVMFTLPAWHF